MRKVTTSFESVAVGFAGSDGVYPEAFGSENIDITSNIEAGDPEMTTVMHVPSGAVTLSILKHWVSEFEKHQQMVKNISN